MKAFKNKCLYLLVLLLVISCAKDEEDLTGSIYGLSLIHISEPTRP